MTFVDPVFMRRAFTLIEILVIVAIIAAMTSTAVVSIRAGQDSARIKGSVRDAFATIRLARSMALVSKQPSIITYSTVVEDGETCARIEVHTSKAFSDSPAMVAETLNGEKVYLSEGGGEVLDAKSQQIGDDADEPLIKDGEGKSTEDYLFEPADNEVFHGIALKVIKDGDELADFREERAKPKISVFSTADFWLNKFDENRAKKKQSEPASPDLSSEPVKVEESQNPVSFVWEVNGRVEPHKVWFYRSGTKYDDGLCISVDRFGAAKVFDPEDER